MLLGVSLCSCGDFLETKKYQEISDKDAFTKLSDAENALNGSYWALGTYRSFGKNIIAIGDMASDNSLASPSTGHFVIFNNYNISETTSELEQIWEYTYRAVNGSTNVINGTYDLEQKVVSSEKSKLFSIRSQAYALRALSSFALVNVFGLPHGENTNPNGGIILVTDRAIVPFQKVSRSSVAETYTQILKDIENAQLALAKSSEKISAFYLNEAAIFALEARVKLYIKDYEGAAEAAQKALEIANPSAMDDEAYINSWTGIALSGETIFSFAKKEDDNLSANSLNTLYGSYGGKLTSDLISIFNSNDIRLQLVSKSDNRGLKYPGTTSNAATNNIPILRVSEMYLIIAEAMAQTGNIAESQKALFYTAKRDLDITSASNLPSNKTGLLDFIALERRREFFQEGHRWYDARRTGEKIMVNNHSNIFDVRKFVYPIPANEINAGAGTQENENWANALPQK